jgi:hypothetical protein
MKCQPKFLVLLLSTAAILATAQSPAGNPPAAQETQTPEQQTPGSWTDPSTKLMWAARDNGKDLNWSKATKHCRDLRLSGYSDWRLATIDELQAIYDASAQAPGLGGKHNNQPLIFHIKGGQFLTGHQWSSSRGEDDRGRPSGYAWYFNFYAGARISDPFSYSLLKRALCVRGSAD